jgi:hypothetical protein
MIVSINNINDENAPVGVSSLGTLVFDNVFFPSGSWTDLEGNEQTYNEVKLDAVTLSVNRAKIIQESRVAGRDGEISEFISNGSYIVNVSAVIAPDTINVVDLAQLATGTSVGIGAALSAGNITSPNNPSQALYDIARLEEVPERVPIRSKFLQNNFNITFVIIKDFNLKKVTADSWTLEMSLKDDGGIDLKDFG